MEKVLGAIVIEDIDLKKIENGVFSGSYSEFLVSVDLDVTVKDHKIVNIEIKDQRSGPGYEATQMLDRVIKAQSLKVDAVAGATGSSKIILLAIKQALTEDK
jgi:uncharacterized protein with FMN-binding domain